ncbi:hypothetical protein Ddc_03360 [Ditylenchus destructor]|nr:hypothetical protein Ddc_03360 [Ditylenchus destructor]
MTCIQENCPEILGYSFRQLNIQLPHLQKRVGRPPFSSQKALAYQSYDMANVPDLPFNGRRTNPAAGNCICKQQPKKTLRRKAGKGPQEVQQIKEVTRKRRTYHKDTPPSEET